MERTRVTQHWIIEALTDLRLYAAENDLPALAEHLEAAIELAHLELANLDDPPPEPPPEDKPDKDDG